jgi:hypothetical protein
MREVEPVNPAEVARTRFIVDRANAHAQNHEGEFDSCTRLQCVQARPSYQPDEPYGTRTDPIEQAVAIVSAEYGEVEAALAKNPIVIGMAEGVRDMWNTQRDLLVGPGGSPKHDFMLTALDTYKKRGGTIGCHIGAVANAITDILGG